MNNKEELVRRLREYYSIPDDIADNQVVKDFKNSIGYAFINLDIAAKNFTKAISEQFRRTGVNH